MPNFDYSTNYSINWKDPLKDNPVQKDCKSTFYFKDLVKITIDEDKALLEIKSGFPPLNQAHLKSLVVAATHFKQEGNFLLQALLQDPSSASFILGNLHLHAEEEVLNKILKTVSEKLTGFQEKPALSEKEIKFLYQFGLLLSSDTLNDHDGVLFLRKGLKELIIEKAPESTAEIEKIEKLKEGLLNKTISSDEIGRFSKEIDPKYHSLLQEALIEIAKIAAAQNGGATSKYIKNYGIESQEALIEIAKIAAAYDDEDTVSIYIKNYGIESQEALIEIAKIAAAHDDLFTLTDNIDEYGIESQEALIEIAKIAAARDGIPVAMNIKSFHITSQKDLWDIYVACLSFELNSTLNFDVDPPSPALTTFLNENIEAVTWDRVENEALPLLQKDHPSAYLMALDIMKKFDKDKPPASLIHSLKWLLIASEQQSGKELSHPIWKDILKYPDPQMRYRLLQSASQVLSNNSSYKTHSIAHMHLPDLLLTEMGIQSLEPLLKSKRIFRDGRALKLLLDTLALLQKEGFSIGKVEKLMTDLLREGKDIQTALELIQGIVACKGLEELQSGEIEDLKNLFEKALKTLVPIQSKNFVEDFLRTFGNQREYTSLLVYAQRQRRNKEVLACLGEMIDSVFNDDYLKKRYQGFHLEKVFTLGPDLEDLWIPNVTFDLKKILNNLDPAQNELPNYYQFFHQKIITDRHIEEGKYPLLLRYLQNKEACTSIGSDEGPSLQLQLQVIEFLEKSPTLSLEEQKKSLIEIQSRFATAADAQNFVHDLQGLIDGFNKKKKNTDELQMLLTDDYWDLFRCGSEVADSCQHIYGNPELNKCLLGYVIDGKNKILEIKGGDGKIRARAILRLLIDDSIQEPVLFLERTYANPGIDQLLQDTLKVGAQELSNNWNLSLYTSGPSSSAVELISLSSAAPWEYLDSADGVHLNGKFTITTAEFIQ